MKKNVTNKKKPRKKYTKKYYYLFKMNAYFLNGLSVIILVLCALLFYSIYGSETLYVLQDSINTVIILYLPYLILHEQLHSLAYVIYGADFKNITFGAHLEKGILCCLCKQRISKKNILHSLLYPFIIIGIITLIIGIIVDYPVLVILSLLNISGCSGDLTMFYHLSRLEDFEFSECDDPMAFGLYTKKNFSNLKMIGLEYVDKKTRLERKDMRKVVISKASIIMITAFYIMVIIEMFL